MSTSSEQPGMRRIPRSLRKSYPAVRLYLDDAKEIFELLQEHFERVTVEAEGYALPSLDDLSEIAKDKIRRLELTGYIGFSTYLTVVLSPITAYQSLNRDDNIALKGVFTQIDLILTRRAPYVRFLASPRTFVGYLVISLLLWCAYSLPTIVHGLQELLAGKVPSVTFSGLGYGDLWNAVNFIYLAWFWFTAWRNHSIIYLQPWRERTSFWDRNKEQIMVGIIVGVIVTIIVSIISFSAGYFVGSQH